MSRSAMTRRPIDNETPPETLISYMPVTSIYTKNGVAITRHSGGDLNGKINTVTISDGFINKVLTMTYDGTTLTGFTTQVLKL